MNSQHLVKLNIATGFALLSFGTLAFQPGAMVSNAPLSFERAIRTAQLNDPWLTGNAHQQKSIEAMSAAADFLPAPRMSVSLANLPTNGFDFNQEAMTQAKIGVSQMFPRGDTLAIKSQQLRTQSQANPYLRADRTSKVAVIVGSLWLETYRVQKSIALIEKNRSLFQQLADVAQANYSSAVGGTRQQDILRAQLELTRLEDRLDILAQQYSVYVGKLSQWLTNVAEYENSLVENLVLDNIALTDELPQIELHYNDLVNHDKWLTNRELIPYFSHHPSVLALDKKIGATRTGIELAKQKYKPEWGVNASYGYRDDDPVGNSRADFFSVGVTFDMPIFTEQKQDNEVRSAIAQTEAIKTERVLLLRQLLSTFSSTKGRLLRLKERQTLYSTMLLPQSYDQAEASLSSYTHDDGDFAEVVRSRIAVLNAEIDALALNVEEQKLYLELNYLFVGRDRAHIADNQHTQDLGTRED